MEIEIELRSGRKVGQDDGGMNATDWERTGSIRRRILYTNRGSLYYSCLFRPSLVSLYGVLPISIDVGSPAPENYMYQRINKPD